MTVRLASRKAPGEAVIYGDAALAPIVLELISTWILKLNLGNSVLVEVNLLGSAVRSYGIRVFNI
jgi:hypothetical protein